MLVVHLSCRLLPRTTQPRSPQRHRPNRALHAGVALRVVVAALTLGALAMPLPAQTVGAVGPEQSPLRRQEWRVPSPDPATLAHAVLLRPQGAGPFPLALIAHASTQNALARAQMGLPDYAVLVSALVARGYAVLLPQRPGHGATGGPYLEDQGGCAAADYARAGHATADSLAAALTFMHAQPFIRKDATLIVGHSAGGWGALALAARNPRGVARIVVFAAGRGGRADNEPLKVCAPERLVATAGVFGRGARVPVLWLVAENDSYFSPTLSKAMADAFRAAGGRVDFRVLPAFGADGHWVAEQADAQDIAAALAGEAPPRR